MLRPLRADKSPSHGKVVHFTKARRYPYGKRPMIEPPLKPFGIDTFGVSEKNRMQMAEADIRVDITGGDLNLVVLRKINYLLDEIQKFADEQQRMRAIGYIIEDVRNYGEPEGLGILKQCYILYGRCEGVLEQLFLAADNIGTVRGMRVLLTAYVTEPSPEHLANMGNFAWWFPGAVSTMVSVIGASPIPRPLAKMAINELEKYAPSESTAVGSTG